MLGFIRKSKIEEALKRAEQRGERKAKKKHHHSLRTKDMKIMRLETEMAKNRKGFVLYQEKRQGYKDLSIDMTDALHEFQNDINIAIASFIGNFDKVISKTHIDSLKDARILRLLGGKVETPQQ